MRLLNVEPRITINMKRISVVIITLLMVGCNQSAEFNDATIEGLSSLPPNAQKEPYDDNPNLVKVTIPGSGDAFSTGDYLNGKRNGNWIEHHPNGVVKSVTGYIDGVKQGGFTTVDDKGQLEASGYYHNGELHGAWKQFNRARVKEERTYINGKLEGVVKVYYPTGKIMEEGMYTNGVRDGVSKWYDQDGNITIEYEYDNGELLNQ